MPAKDHRYRKVKKWLEPYQKECDAYSVKLVGAMIISLDNLFNRKIVRNIRGPGFRVYVRKNGPEYNPYHWTKQELKKKYRTPLNRRKRWQG